MTDTKIQRFKITIPIVKTSVKIVKDEDGNEVEERYIEGVASGTELDKHGDRMAPSAIESMAKSLKQHVINLNNEHDTSWSGELGDITKLTISDNDDLEIKSKLNEMSSAKDLWYAITEQNKKLGLSIGGYVKDYEMVKEGEGDDAKWVRLYKKIDLDHIAVTSRPAYPKSWVSNIAKSVKDNDEVLLRKVKKEEKSKRSQKEKRMRELARAIARSIQELESDLLLELCYKGLKFCNEEQILLLERSLPTMKKKNVSLEAKKAKKKADAAAKSEGEQDETLATPDNESSKEKSKEDKETKDKSGDECGGGKSAKKNPAKDSKPKDEPEESESDKEEPEGESDNEEGEDKGEKGDKSPESDEETKSEKDKKKSSKEESEKKSTKGDKGELVKAVKGLSKGLEDVLKSNEALAGRVKELESQPAGRKTVEIHKALGDEDGEVKSSEELTKARDKKIEAVRKEFANDPNLFARVQRIRAEYAQKAQE